MGERGWWVGPRLKQSQRSCGGVREGRDLRDHQVGPGEPGTLRLPLRTLHPSCRTRVSGLSSLLEGAAEGRSPAAPSEAGPGSRRQEPGSAPPLGALLWEGPRRLPTHSGGRERSRPASCWEPLFDPAACAAGSRGGRSRGAALAPPQPSEERGSLPAGGRGRSPRSPSPPSAPG